MRLLHIYGGNLYGGVERLLVGLAQFANYAPAVQQEFAFCYSGRLSREIAAAGATIHPLGAVRVSRPWQVLRARRRLLRWLRQHYGGDPANPKLDMALCHAWWAYAIFGPVLRQAGIPVGLWAHDPATGRGWLERWAGRRSPDWLITHGEYMAASLYRLFPHQTAQTLHAPVAIPPILPAAARTEMRRQLGAASASTVILQVSRLEPWKGHRLLLDALAQLRDHPEWIAWIAGGAQRPHERVYLRRLQAQAQGLGLEHRVRWLGERTDIASLLQAADIFAQPNSKPEPFGIVFVEALAAGLPVVATAGGGVPEIVTPSCGLLAEPNAEAVAQALRKLIVEPALRRQMASHAPARARMLADPATQLRHFQHLVEDGTRRAGKCARDHQ